MGESSLRIIPATPSWVPTRGAALVGRDVLASLCPNAEDVSPVCFETVQFVDEGGNFDEVSCPKCMEPLSMDRWGQAMDRAAERDFSDLRVVTPCCSSPTSLNDLGYEWPAGFARFVLEARQPGRGWLDASELAAVAEALGTPVRQIIARI